MKKNFVVAHGAWAGSWGWEAVSSRIRKTGNEIYVPTLSGLGERSHLSRFPIDLDLHIADVENEIRWKDLKNVTLIGHSYGGIVATGVADRLSAEISSLVFLDAFVPEHGMSFSDFDPNWSEEGPLVDPPPFPLPEDIKKKVTAQPIRTMTQKIHLTGAYKAIPKKTYILCTGWNGPFAALSKKLRNDSSWSYKELKSGHDAPTEQPDALVELLLNL